MMKHGKVFLVYLAAFFLQPFLQNLIPALGTNLNLILCLTVMLIFVEEEPGQAVFFGSLFALLGDLFYGLYTGPSAVAMVGCGVAVYLLKHFVHIENYFSSILFMAVSTWLYYSLYWCIYAMIGTPYSYFYAMGEILPQILCNAVCGFGVYYVLLQKVKKQKRDRYYR